MRESQETPSDESKAHSARFLKMAARMKGRKKKGRGKKRKGGRR